MAFFSLLPTPMIAHFTTSWPCWAALAVWSLLLVLGILNVLSANTIIRKRYSSGRYSALLASKRAAVSKLPNLLTKGRSKFAPMLSGVVVMGVLAFGVGASYRHPGTSKIVELHDVKVLRDIGRYDYWLETKDAGKFYTTFCADYEPQFSAGQTLTILKFEDRGACWSVANTHPAYKLRRNPDGTPTTDRTD